MQRGDTQALEKGLRGLGLMRSGTASSRGAVEEDDELEALGEA